MYGLAEARRRGFTVSAHVPVALTLDQVSEAGLGSIEHMSYLLRGGSPREAELSAAVAAGQMSAADAVTAMIDSFDEATALATFGRLAARGTAVTPTLNGSRILAYLDQDTHAGDDYLKYIGPGLQATYEGRVTRAAADDAAAVARRHARFERSATLVPLLQRAGVTILAGTDAGFLNSFNYPGIGLHDELALLVKSGLTPQQALVASVVNGPTFLHAADRYGAVAAGKVADLLRPGSQSAGRHHGDAGHPRRGGEGPAARSPRPRRDAGRRRGPRRASGRPPRPEPPRQSLRRGHCGRQAELAHEEGQLRGRLLHTHAEGQAAIGGMPGLGVIAQEHRPARGARRLQPGRELARRQRRHARVEVAGAEHHRRVGGAWLHLLIRRVPA